MDYKFRCECPITSALDILGDKWVLVIIKQMLIEDKKTFKDFTESDEAIATNILTDRLKSLKSKGIIDFAFAPNNKKTKYYFLTDMGIDLYPVIYEMAMWSRRNLDKDFNDIASNWFADNIDKDGQEVKVKSIEEYKVIRQDLFELVQA